MSDRLQKHRRVVHRVTTSDNELQRVTTSGTTSDKGWQRVATSGTMIDNKWQQVVQQVIKSENEWQRVATNGNEWQQVRAVVQRMKTAQYTSKNGRLPSFLRQKEMHYYFKGWMAAIRVVR